MSGGGIVENPMIEVRYENLSVEGESFAGSRAIPSLLNGTLNAIENVMGLYSAFPLKKRKIKILKNLNGIVKPSRMTLLLGPPGSGKTTFLQALAGKLNNKDLSVSGKVTYCGHELNEFFPEKTCAFVGQHDLLMGQMTVRETLEFSARFQGIGSRYETFAELLRMREKDDPSKINTGQETRTFVTDYILKTLKLENCADTVIGDAMRRGISGGEKKRAAIGETLVGPAQVLLMDEISNGLDSLTTFQICEFVTQMVCVSDMTVVVSLLQPTPETFRLFDDVILLSEGYIVYQGPRENILEFFEGTGFKCPKRKGIAEFLQDVTSEKDQEEYWFRKDRAYSYVSVPDFVEAFKSFEVGQKLEDDRKSRASSTAFLAKKKYGKSGWESLEACFSREWLLTKRNFPITFFKLALIVITSMIALSAFFKTEMEAGNIRDGAKFLGAIYFGLITASFNGMVDIAVIIFRLPIFYRQRDSSFYPAWAFALPLSISRIPLAILESGFWVVLTYYTIGFAPSPSRFFKQFLAFFGIYQMSVSLALLVGAVGRTQSLVNLLGPMTMAVMVTLGGFLITKNEIGPWLSWSCYLSPLMYGHDALSINEFLDKRWSLPIPGVNGSITFGKFILESVGVPTQEYWFWVCIGALFGFSLLFSVLFVVALTYLNPISDSKQFVQCAEDRKGGEKPLFREIAELTELPRKRGPIVPILPISLAFNHVNYYVDTPIELKRHGSKKDRIQLLTDVSGAFRAGKLTAIVGVTGAGKTTLMDILSGRKTGGYVEGNITVSGYPKRQDTFSRVSGYCEQNDIHSPNITVYESLMYSAWLRLPADLVVDTMKMFVEDIMGLLELNPIRGAIVGLPGINGLSMEQRKRLTIAVELVANPSIVFMDEPTSGLDSKSAAIVTRTVRNIVDVGRTVVCTIHQPSISMFEAFDELMLMKLGGQVIYAGPLGHNSHKLIEYFEGIPGIPKICEGLNPATWVLEVTDPLVETRLNVDFAEIYTKSLVYQKNQELIEQLNTPEPGSNDDLNFLTKHSQPFYVQLRACFWKQHRSYWRSPQYIATRFSMAIIIGTFLGLVFFHKGQKIKKQKDLMNFLGAIYAAVVFLGSNNGSSVQTIVSVEKTVFYRERAAGMYSALAYAFAQASIEIIYTALQSLVFTLILFPLFGLEWTVAKFFWFYYFVSMFLTYFTLFGMMLVAISPGIEVSLSIMIFFIRVWNLFSGFFIFRTEIPKWDQWYYWASPMAWTVYGLVTSQVGDEIADLEELGLGSEIPLKTFLKETFGFDYEFLTVVALAHAGWVLFFLIVFACGIKYVNFQKR